MRVVAGSARGRRLVAPPGDGVRPTSDRVKEAWFSSLAQQLPGAHVLDIYAGSGALGIEAASRGAAVVVSVERDRRTLEVLQRNVATTGVAVTVVSGDVARVVHPAMAGAPFDLVLADPPYLLERDVLAGVLALLPAVMAEGGQVWLEQARRAGAPPWPDALQPVRDRRYGDTVLHTAELVGDRA